MVEYAQLGLTSRLRVLLETRPPELPMLVTVYCKYFCAVGMYIRTKL